MERPITFNVPCLLAALLIAATTCKDDSTSRTSSSSFEASGEVGTGPAPTPTAGPTEKPVPEPVPEAAPEPAAEPQAPSPKAQASDPPINLAPDVTSAANMLPGNAMLITALHAEHLDDLAAQAFEFPFLELPTGTGDKLKAAYRKYLDGRLGVDAGEVRTAIFFVSADKYVGLLLLGPTLTLKKGEKGRSIPAGERDAFVVEEDPRLWLIAAGDGAVVVLFGETDTQKYLASVLDGDGGMKKERLARFTAPMEARAHAWFATVASMDSPLLAMAWAGKVPVETPEHIAIFIENAALTLSVKGGESCLTALAGLYEQGRSVLKAQAQDAAKDLDSLSLVQGLEVLMAPDLVDLVFDMYKPAVADGRIELTLDMGVPGVSTVAILSISAVIAVPAFIKYTRRAKSSEASEVMDKIYRGAVDYYSAPRVDSNANLLPCQFPPSTGPTPSAGTCCADLGGPDSDGDDRCDADGEWWQSEAWKGHFYENTMAHYYVYEFKSQGTGNGAEFTITAHGDLDCDGVKSTFERRGVGKVDADGVCTVAPERGFYIENELE